MPETTARSMLSASIRGPCHGPVGAAELPPVGDAIEVRAGQQPWAGAAGYVAEDIQCRVYARLEPRLSDPLGIPAPAGQVGIGPGQPVDAAVRLCPDGR